MGLFSISLLYPSISGALHGQMNADLLGEGWMKDEFD